MVDLLMLQKICFVVLRHLIPDLVIYLRTSEINLSEKPSDCIAEKIEQKKKQEEVIKKFQSILNGNSTISLIEVNGDLPFDFNTRLIEQKIIVHNQSLNKAINFVPTTYYVPC